MGRSQSLGWMRFAGSLAWALCLGLLGAWGAVVAPAVLAQESERKEPSPAQELKQQPREFCVVFGKLVDVRAEPIAGARVTLGSCYSFKTGNETDPPNPWSWWSVRSAGDGSFRLEMPMPDQDFVRLQVLPDVHHLRLGELMGPGYTNSRAWLVEGQLDMGLIEVGDACLVGGRVLDEAGEPLAGVDVRASTSTRTGVVRLVDSTDERGRFEIGHLPQGAVEFVASRSGFLLEKKSAVRVRRTPAVSDLEFVLRTAPVFRGRVIDDQGRALVGVKLSLRARQGGRSIAGVSGPQGEFALPVQADAPHSIVAKLEGYENVLGGQTVYHELAERCVVVLRRQVQTRFVVFDDETGERVESFNVLVFRGQGAAALPESRYASDVIGASWTARARRSGTAAHMGGEALIACQPGEDRFGLVAPDYLPVEGEVVHESTSSNRQVVRLKRGAGVEGNVVHGGQPVIGARVRIERGSWSGGKDGAGPMGAKVDVPEFKGGAFVVGAGGVASSRGTFQRTAGFSADKGTRIEGGTVADGSFAIRGLSPGTYRVEIRDRRGLSAVVVPVHVVEGRSLQLGPIVLSEPGQVRGRVLTPQGVSAQGIEVTGCEAQDRGRQLSSVRTGPGGEFHFDGVSNGRYTLRVRAIEGVLGESERVPVSVRDGASPDVTLDMRSCGLCRLELELHFPGVGQSPLPAFLVSAEPGRASAPLTIVQSPAEIVEGFFSAFARAYVEIRTPAGVVFRQPAEGLALPQQGFVQRRLDFSAGALELQLPADLEFPARGKLLVRLHPTTASPDTPDQELVLNITENRRAQSPQERVDLETRRVHIALVPAGPYRAELELLDLNAKREQLGSDEQGEALWGRRPVYRGACTLTIPAGGVGAARVE